MRFPGLNYPEFCAHNRIQNFYVDSTMWDLLRFAPIMKMKLSLSTKHMFIDIIDYGYGCTTPVVRLLRYIV